MLPFKAYNHLKASNQFTKLSTKIGHLFNYFFLSKSVENGGSTYNGHGQINRSSAPADDDGKKTDDGKPAITSKSHQLKDT
jgi:hypothetical protein